METLSCCQPCQRGTPFAWQAAWQNGSADRSFAELFTRPTVRLYTVLHNDWTTIAIGAVFGWPAVAAALVTLVAAVWLDRPSLAIVATLISAPFCLFVSGYPRVGWWAIGVLASNLIGALALRFGWGRFSVSFWIPFVLLVGWLMAVVFGQ